MNTINLDRYLPELTAMYAFYRYSEAVFADAGLRDQIAEQEFSTLLATIMPFLNDPKNPQEVEPLFRDKIHEQVVSYITSGLAVLRGQILEASHSIFEKFLCHVVRVYLHTFPAILMDIDKQIPYRTIAELKTNGAIFDHVVEKEVSHFSRRSLQEKKDYLAKRLKHTHQDEVWTYEWEELWKDIDRKRQSIVHEEAIPEISNEYLVRAINALQKIMMGISTFAQVDQGIRFTWGQMSEHVKSKEAPTLKP